MLAVEGSQFEPALRGDLFPLGGLVVKRLPVGGRHGEEAGVAQLAVPRDELSLAGQHFRLGAAVLGPNAKAPGRPFLFVRHESSRFSVDGPT